jgi:hypothetical protein
MKDVVVLSNWLLKNVIMEVSGGKDPFKYFPIPKVPINVTVQVADEDWQAMTKDPLLWDTMRQTFKGVIKSHVNKTIIPTLHKYDERWKTAHLREFASLRKSVTREVNESLEKIYPACERMMKYKMAEIAGQKQQYQRYRWKVAKQAVINTAAVGTAVAGVAGSAAAGGATLALAIVGLYRSVMGMIKFICDCAIEAETCQRNVIQGIDYVKKSYGLGAGPVSGAKKAGNTAKELSSNFFLDSVLRAPRKKQLTTIDNIKKELTLWGDKLANLRSQAHDLSVQLGELLEKQHKMMAELAVDAAVAAELPDTGKWKSKLDEIEKKHKKALKETEKDTKQLLEKGFYIPSMAKWITIEELHKRAETGGAKIKGLDSLLDKWEKEGLAKGALIASAAMDVALSISLMVANYTESALTADNTLFLTSDTFFGITAPQDLVGTINTLYDFAISCGAEEVDSNWGVLLES